MSWSYWLALVRAVDAESAEHMEAACWVKAAAALPAVTQTVVSTLNQSLTGPQHSSLSKHTHSLTH